MTIPHQDVAVTRQQALELAAAGSPVLLVLEAVVEHVPSFAHDPQAITVERIGEGQSNITFLLKTPTDAVVVRRPPAPPYAPSAHDVIREAAVVRALAATDVPVPDVLAICEDSSQIGAPFYVMKYIDAEVITTTTPARFDNPVAKENLAMSLVDTLVAIHTVDPASVPLPVSSNPRPYLVRQLERYSTIWSKVRVREIPGIDAVGRKLVETMPTAARTTVVHGDYRMGNLMWSHDPVPSISAVLDWELASLGDPLADLAYFLTTYPDDNDHLDVLLGMSGAILQGGYPSRSDLLKRYESHGGITVDRLEWYEAFVRWRAAIGLESIYQRMRTGRVAPNAWLRSLEHGVPELVSKAERSLAQVVRR